jgi:SAM-dependent methyltransferase
MSSPTSAQPDLNALRPGLHAMWASVAPGWATWADDTDARGAHLVDRMLECAAVAAGDRVLELACGPGGAGLAAAERVGPSSPVVLTDVAAEMTAIAAARAAERGLDQVETRVRDLEEIDEPDGAFDVVLCREGLMLVPEPARAAGEIARVLAPGGRFAVAVWGPRGRNPWLGGLFDAVTAQTGAPVPPAGLPGPFSLDDRDRFAAALDVAGLADVEIEEVDFPMRFESFDTWWTRVGALAGPLANLLAALPEEGRTAIRDHAAATFAPHRSAAGELELPAVALLAGGRRA